MAQAEVNFVLGQHRPTAQSSQLTLLLTCSSKKRDGELTVAQGRVKELESLFHRSEVELAAALSDKHSLESDVAELRAQLAKVGLGQAPVCRQEASRWWACEGPGGPRNFTRV